MNFIDWITEDTKNVLQHIMVRRTRRDIENIYSDDLEKQGLKFVEVNEADLNKIDIIRKDVNIKPTTNDKEEVNNMLDELKEDNNIDDIKKIK